MRRRPGRSTAAPVLALWCCGALLLALIGPARATADNSRWGANYFPNVVLTTQDGKQVKFYDDLLKGKIVAVDLIYTTCKYACPLETARLAQVQTLLGDRMGRDVFFYSITIDPEHDTPAVLKAYAEKFHAGPGWLFLTGSAKDIELVSRKLGIYSEPDPANKDGHTPSLVVGNEATGQWMRNSALDNARFLATTIGNWMNSWRTAKAGASYAEARPLALDAGEYTFSTHCAPCHTIGGGQKVGPDLAGVARTRDRQWLTRFIVSPATMVAQGDPAAVAVFQKYKPLQMPNLNLTPADAATVIRYLEEHDPGAAEARAAVAALPSGTTLGPTIEHYLPIQEALSRDSLDGVGTRATALASEAARLGPAAAGVREAAEGLGQAATLAEARAAFGRLGDALLACAKASTADLGANVRVAYCPMARKYWLQRGEEIRNPYFGRAMLDCGRLVGGGR